MNDIYLHILKAVDYNDPAVQQVHLLLVCKRWYVILSGLTYTPERGAIYRYSRPVVLLHHDKVCINKRIVLLSHFMDAYPRAVVWDNIAHNQTIPPQHAHRVNWGNVSSELQASTVRYNAPHIRWDRVRQYWADAETVSAILAVCPAQIRWYDIFMAKRSLWFTLRYGWRSCYTTSNQRSAVGWCNILERLSPVYYGLILLICTVAAASVIRGWWLDRRGPQ